MTPPPDARKILMRLRRRIQSKLRTCRMGCVLDIMSTNETYLRHVCDERDALKAELERARLEALDACAEMVSSRIKTAYACAYATAFIAGLEDIRVFLAAMRDRVSRGEGYHSRSELMTLSPAPPKGEK